MGTKNSNIWACADHFHSYHNNQQVLLTTDPPLQLQTSKKILSPNHKIYLITAETFQKFYNVKSKILLVTHISTKDMQFELFLLLLVASGLSIPTPAEYI